MQRLTVFVLACATVACRPKPPAAAAPPPPAVTVARPIEREIVEQDEYTGRTEAVNFVEVRARVSGTLQKVHFEDGTLVKQGDPLFTIDPREFQAALDHAEADLQRARADLELASNEWKRVENIGTNGAVAQEEVEQRRLKQSTSEAVVKAAQSAVESAHLDVEYANITAPIDGRIGRKLVSEGNVVNSGPTNGTLLATIVSVDPMYCYIDANEQAVLKYIHLARTGERASARDQNIPARFALADEKEFTHEGVVDFVDNRIDPTTGTMRARVVFPNKDGRLVPGLFVRVKIPGSGKYQALLVDDQAIGTDLNQRYVLTVDDKNSVHYQAVELGPIVEGLRVVRSGIDAKSQVIVNGLMRSRPGAVVAPKVTEMDPHKRPQEPDASAPPGSQPAGGSASDKNAPKGKSGEKSAEGSAGKPADKSAGGEAPMNAPKPGAEAPKNTPAPHSSSTPAPKK